MTSVDERFQRMKNLKHVYMTCGEPLCPDCWELWKFDHPNDIGIVRTACEQPWTPGSGEAALDALDRIEADLARKDAALGRIAKLQEPNRLEAAGIALAVLEGGPK